MKVHRHTWITVPPHNPLRTGTLHSILTEVAQMRSLAMVAITELGPLPLVAALLE
jgi:hypothetical protein